MSNCGFFGHILVEILCKESVWIAAELKCTCDCNNVWRDVCNCLFLPLSLCVSLSPILRVNGTASVARHSRHIHRANIPNPNLSLAPLSCRQMKEWGTDSQAGQGTGGQKGQYSLNILRTQHSSVSLRDHNNNCNCSYLLNWQTVLLLYLFWYPALILILAWTACTRELHTRYNERH